MNRNVLLLDRTEIVLDDVRNDLVAQDVALFSRTARLKGSGGTAVPPPWPAPGRSLR